MMPFTFSKVNAVIRAVRMSRQRQVAAARMAALEESNSLLQDQARKLEHQTNEARELAHELALTNEELRALLAGTFVGAVERDVSLGPVPHGVEG